MQTVENSSLTPKTEDPIQTREYFQTVINDGYRGLKGIIIGTVIAEAILIIGNVTGTPMLIFAGIGAIYALRHLLQIWHAKQQLHQLSQ